MSIAAACSWPLRVSPQAAKDFGGLNAPVRERVIRCLANAICPGKWEKLEGDRGELWRVRVGRDTRLLVNVQRGIAYLWRIADRKDVYRTIRNQDPRLALTGVTIEEFLMKPGAKKDAKSNNGAAKAAASGNGSSGGHAAPPAAVAAPGDGESTSPPSHPLLTALSQYLGEYVRTDMDAILAIVEDRADGFEGEILTLGESLAKLDAREGEIAAALASHLEHTAGLAQSQESLSQGVEQLRSRIDTLDDGLTKATSRLGGEISACSLELDRRLGEIHAAAEEDRRIMNLGLGELGRQLELLSAEGSTLRTTTDAHESSLRRLEGELVGSSARLERLTETVAGLSGELERLRGERSSRNTLRHLATLATRIRAAFSPRGAA